jgi:hypothetical protein
MKRRKNVFASVLALCLMLTGFVYADNPTNEPGALSYSSSVGGLGWQEGTSRQRVFYSDGIRVTTGPTVGITGISLAFNFSSVFTFIECCRPTTLKQSWCNFSADDPRCAD